MPIEMTMYRATTDTRHFEWETFGTTEKEARQLLGKMLRKHTEFTREEVRAYVEDANVYEIRAGLTLRDRQEVN